MRGGLLPAVDVRPAGRGGAALSRGQLGGGRPLHRDPVLSRHLQHAQHLRRQDGREDVPGGGGGHHEAPARPVPEDDQGGPDSSHGV